MDTNKLTLFLLDQYLQQNLLQNQFNRQQIPPFGLISFSTINLIKQNINQTVRQIVPR